MKKNQSFSNSSLERINIEAEGVILNHLRILDQISNDIKKLEERLKTSGLPFVFRYILSSEVCRYEEKGFQEALEFLDQIETCLVWDKSEGDNYRLSYNIYTTKNKINKYHSDSGDYENIRKIGEPKLTFTKPLIETNSHFRIKIEKELAPFYKAIIEALKTKSDQDFIIEYSPNYIPF